MKKLFVSELISTAFLVMVVLGSGIMGQTLFPDSTGLALLANSIATGAGLFVLIQSFSAISGAHMNPAVSLVEMLRGNLSAQKTLLYFLAQMLGAYLGVLLTHAMFAKPLFEISMIERSGSHLFLSEIIATAGLIGVIMLVKENVALNVALYITSAYWFTSSTSFANPAVTFARVFTNSFGGMSPAYLLSFVSAQLLGALLIWGLLRKT